MNERHSWLEKKNYEQGEKSTVFVVFPRLDSSDTTNNKVYQRTKHSSSKPIGGWWKPIEILKGSSNET